MKPGVYESLPLAEYLAFPALSAGVLHTLNSECPKAAWWTSHLNPRRERDDSNASDTGTVAHEILLEGSEDCCCIIDPADYPGERGGIPTGWTNKPIRAARDEARAAGKTPVLIEQMATIRAMVSSAREFIDSLRATEPAIWRAFQPDGGRSEVSFLWDEDGILCRARPDRISNDNRVTIHVKSTLRTVEPSTWSRTAMSTSGYWLTSSWYARGILAHTGVASAQFFLVLDQDAPHLCSLIGVDPQGMTHGGEQVERGLQVWRRCLEADYWPAYPNRALYPQIPAYAIAEWQERTAEGAGNPYDLDAMFQRRAA